jgi:hypothetical protein
MGSLLKFELIQSVRRKRWFRHFENFETTLHLTFEASSRNLSGEFGRSAYLAIFEVNGSNSELSTFNFEL